MGEYLNGRRHSGWTYERRDGSGLWVIFEDGRPVAGALLRISTTRVNGSFCANTRGTKAVRAVLRSAYRHGTRDVGGRFRTGPAVTCSAPVPTTIPGLSPGRAAVPADWPMAKASSATARTNAMAEHSISGCARDRGRSISPTDGSRLAPTFTATATVPGPTVVARGYCDCGSLYFGPTHRSVDQRPPSVQ